MIGPWEVRSLLSLRSNLSPLDRTIRITLGLAALALPLLFSIERHVALALILFAWVPLVTGVVSWCPIYELFGFSTRCR